MASVGNDDLAEGPSTPRQPKPQNLQDTSQSSSTPSGLPSTDTVNSSPGSARKRKNDEIYPSSPSRSNDTSSRPATATERPKQLAAPLDFSPKRPTHTFAIHSMEATKPSELNPGKTANAASNADPVQPSQTFIEQIERFKRGLEDEYTTYEQNLQSAGQGELEDLDWEDLETRYHDAIKPLAKEEEEQLDDFNTLFRHFILWMQVSNNREAERAIKRLRTRIAFVQNSEEKLAEKQAHYQKVLNAFQSAMALLGNL